MQARGCACKAQEAARTHRSLTSSRKEAVLLLDCIFNGVQVMALGFKLRLQQVRSSDGANVQEQRGGT